MLFCRHLDHLKLGKFANFLTRCDISFYCAARNTIVIDVEGIDASVMIRLMHYAELPIPTTEAQGAFSLNIRSAGVCSFNRTLLAFRVSFGRIGALPSYPVQIRSKELNGLLTFPIKESAIVTWLQSKISGFNFQLVTCVNDEQLVEEYLQFRISAATPDSFPNHYSFNGVNFRIDHALPYATPISSGVRPPSAQSVHEHWKLPVQRTSNDRKGHANTIEKVENCPGSIQRFLKLREVSFQDDSHVSSAFFEKGHVPLCFFRKEVPVDVAVDQFSYWCRSLKALDELTLSALDRPITGTNGADPGDDCMRLCIATAHCRTEQSLKIGLFVKGKYGWIVSTSERLHCYAYTICTLMVVLPVGYRIEDICSPAEHISIQKIVPLSEKRTYEGNDGSNQVVDSASAATPLGSNPLHLQGSTQRSEVLHLQQCNSPKMIIPDKEMSPTLPWPKHDHENAQVGNPEGSHLRDRPCRSLESKGDGPEAAIIDSRSRDHPPGTCECDDVDEEPANTTNGRLIQSQPHPKGVHPGLVQPQAEVKAPAFPPACQQSGSSPMPPNTISALYAGEGHMPKLVTAESCAAEGIPDPRSNDNTELQQMCDPKLQSDAQEVLPPGPTLRSSTPRERKSRSVSVSKRGSFSKTRPASFARSVSPTISKFQTGYAKEQLKSCLQTTPHKQKGNTARNKSHMHPLQVDVSKPVATPVPPDVEMSRKGRRSFDEI